MSLSHLSQRFMLTGGFSVSGVDNGLPGGRPFVKGSINADVATVLVSILSPTLTSFVGIFIFTSPIVMVPLLLWSAFVVWVVLADEDFRDTLGEFVEDLLDTLGDIDFLRHGDVRLDNLWRLSDNSMSGSRGISATLGDSVSL